jgi:hypothetical protein
VLVAIFFGIRCDQFPLLAATALGSFIRTAVVIFLWHAVNQMGMRPTILLVVRCDQSPSLATNASGSFIRTATLVF